MGLESRSLRKSSSLTDILKNIVKLKSREEYLSQDTEYNSLPILVANEVYSDVIIPSSEVTSMKIILSDGTEYIAKVCAKVGFKDVVDEYYLYNFQGDFSIGVSEERLVKRVELWGGMVMYNSISVNINVSSDTSFSIVRSIILRECEFENNAITGKAITGRAIISIG